MALPSGPMIRPLSSAGVAARVRLARRCAFSASIAPALPAGVLVTATATTSEGTSEFSGCRMALVKGRVETSAPPLLKAGFQQYGEERAYHLARG